MLVFIATTLIIWPKLVYPMTLRLRYTLRHSLCHYINCRRSFLVEKFLTQFGTSNLTSMHLRLWTKFCTISDVIGISWHTNLPLLPWHGFSFFERLVESTKELFRKELETYRLTYNELQTVLHETEAILKKRLVT